MMTMHHESPQLFIEAKRILEKAVEDRVIPGGVLLVGQRAGVSFVHTCGRLTGEADATHVTAETLYDLSSVTKVAVTTSIAMRLWQQGSLDLASPVKRYLPSFTGGAKESVTLQHLLEHSSGLDWWAPLYQKLKGRAAYIERIASSDLVYAPGSRLLYSDLGFILLGHVLEQITGEDLDAIFQREIAKPLGFTRTRYLPPKEWRSEIAPTRFDPERQRLLQGEVDDNNAFAMGGVAGHAGLFGSAPELARWASAILQAARDEGGGLFEPKTFARFTVLSNVPGSYYMVGWDTPSGRSAAGQFFGPGSFGHLGTTGTSIWFEPREQIFILLLTNRLLFADLNVFPPPRDLVMRELRASVHDAVMRVLVESSPPPPL